MKTATMPLTLYVDTSCPLCAWEVHLLHGRSHPLRLHLVDISAAGFDPTPLNISLEQLQNCLHARTASGTWLTENCSQAGWD
jgi:predicted DCC family thiol-disulfide oxidoreductase YuxK